MHICFLLSFTPNPRMNKRMRALKTQHDITLIYWKRSAKYLWGDVIEGIPSEEIEIQANNGNPLKRLIPTFKFAKAAMRNLKKQKPECIYVQNIDMLFIAVLYRIFIDSTIKIVYEIADIHEIVIQPQKKFIRRSIQYFIRLLEKKLCRKADLLVLTSEKYYECYYSSFWDKDKYLYMANVPERKVFEKYHHKKDGAFTVGFIGAVRFEKQIRLLIQACKICGVGLEIIGSFLDEQLEVYCKDNDVLCYGKYNYDEEIAELYGRLDCVFSVYPSEDYNVNIAVPNKLYESIICGLPIIVSEGTYLAELVKQYGVGVEVACDDVKSYVEMINKLKNDKQFYQTIVNNCAAIKESCYVEKYNRDLLQRIACLKD